MLYARFELKHSLRNQNPCAKQEANKPVKVKNTVNLIKRKTTFVNKAKLSEI